MSKNWRESLASETPNSDFKRYKTDNNVELPNKVEFTGDKLPSSGDSAKKEVDAWESGSKLFEKDRRREDSGVEYGSALQSEKVKRDDAQGHVSDSEGHAKPSYASQATKKDKLDLEREQRKIRDQSYIRQCSLCGGVVDKKTGECTHCGADYPKKRSSYASKDWRGVFAKFNGKAQCVECKYVGDDFEMASFGVWACPNCGESVSLMDGSLIAVHINTPELEDNLFEIGKDKAINDPALPIFDSSSKGWREVLSDVSFKNLPDGTVKIDITSHPNEPLVQNPNTQQPQPASPAEADQTVEASTKRWVIDKRGSIELVGEECATCATIAIVRDGNQIERYSTQKNGHTWRELINQAEWQEKIAGL